MNEMSQSPVPTARGKREATKSAPDRRNLREATKSAPDRRNRNRSRTRHALSNAAVELFASQGYAATTVEQIADAAGVSPRTFFRYFASKEDVLLPLDYDMGAAEALCGQPLELTDMEALRTVLVSRAPVLEPAFAQLSDLRNALSTSAALRGRDFDERNRSEDEMANALATRRALSRPDPEARLAAVVGFAILRVAITRWLELPPPASLARLLDEEFDRAEQIMVKGLEAAMGS